METPEWARNAPEIPLGSETIYSAFVDLGTSRSSGWGPGPIPWTAIRDYATARGYDEDEYEDLLHLVRVLDREYLEWVKKQAPDPTAKPKTK